MGLALGDPQPAPPPPVDPRTVLCSHCAEEREDDGRWRLAKSWERCQHPEHKPFRGMKFVPARLAGSCLNGAERDGGALYHALPNPGGVEGGGFFGKALCGAEPGRRSAGFSIYDKDLDRPITCKRCLKRLERMS